MKLITQHIGQVIIAIAGIVLIVCSIVMFKPEIGGFFSNTISKLTGIGTEIVLKNLDDTNLTPGTPNETDASEGTFSNHWEPVTWNGLTNFNGDYVWTDGDNTYYTENSVSYILKGDTWEAKTWNGFNPGLGSCVWTDGTNIYYSGGTNKHYVLNKATDTWETKTWNYTNFSGDKIWRTKNFVFYCNWDVQIALRDGKWLNAANAFTGLDEFSGEYVWTDGTSYYYSLGGSQYKLNSWNWEAINWEGLPDNGMDGNNIWTDGENIYLSQAGADYQFKLNTETLTAEPVIWTGISDECWNATGIYGLSGDDIWTDGTNIYCSEYDKFSDKAYHYVRVKN